ncbi:hypothetical protein U9R90_26820 [Streptomyces sp. E11-3]
MSAEGLRAAVTLLLTARSGAWRWHRGPGRTGGRMLPSAWSMSY